MLDVFTACGGEGQFDSGADCAELAIDDTTEGVLCDGGPAAGTARGP